MMRGPHIVNKVKDIFFVENILQQFIRKTIIMKWSTNLFVPFAVEICYEFVPCQTSWFATSGEGMKVIDFPPPLSFLRFLLLYPHKLMS